METWNNSFLFSLVVAPLAIVEMLKNVSVPIVSIDIVINMMTYCILLYLLKYNTHMHIEHACMTQSVSVPDTACRLMHKSSFLLNVNESEFPCIIVRCF